MAKIISSRKKYVPVKDLTVYPSKTETIEVLPDDGFSGAHKYRAQMCAGFVNGKTKYVDATDTIQFVHKHEDGTVTPGWYYDNPPIFDGESWNVDPTYDCLECMGAVNDLHPANLFRFPIPEDMTYEDEPIKFEICLK